MMGHPNKIATSIHAAIDEEFDRAYRKHNGRTPRSWAVSNGEALSILVEEVGEVARALTYDEGDETKLAWELIQVATMAAAWAERVIVQGDHPGGVPIVSGRSFETGSDEITTEVHEITTLERSAA